MWRKTLCLRSLAEDVITGVSSDYRPRYRPRRLVMPVDRWNAHSDQRKSSSEFSQHVRRKVAMRTVRKRGALSLSTVPAERTAADAVRLALETATASGLTNPDKLVEIDDQCAALATALKNFAEEVEKHSAARHAPGSSTGIVSLGTRDSSSSVTPRALQIWDLLEKTTMDAPAHGVLALRGKALVESTILECLYEVYPRMRSRHAQILIHQCTGLLPISRIALRLGLVDAYNVHTECGLWRELNTLRERFRVARRMATIHKERTVQGLMAQRRWYWRGALKSASRKLAKFPASVDQLKPRLEWLRHQVFQWIASVEELEGPGVARTLILRLFCSQLGKKWHTLRLERQAESMLKAHSSSSSSDARDALEKSFVELLEKRSGKAKYRDALDENDTTHPLNDRARHRQEQRNSSFGTHAMQPLLDDVQSTRWQRAEHLAPPLVVDLVQPTNAFREIQIILKYDPFVSEELREAPIDVDVTIGKTVEVQETNSLSLSSDYQQFRQVQSMEVKLFAGHHCIGVGKGETEMLATQEASIHALLNYYLRQGAMLHNNNDNKQGVEPPTAVNAEAGWNADHHHNPTEPLYPADAEAFMDCMMMGHDVQ